MSADRPPARPAGRAGLRLLALAVAAAAACATSAQDYTGAFVLAKCERGDVYYDHLDVAPGVHLVRAIAVVEAAPARVFESLLALEAHPLWRPGVRAVDGISVDGDEIEARATLTRHGLPPLETTERVRAESARGEVSITTLGGGWLRGATSLYTVQPLDGGRRALVTAVLRTEVAGPAAAPHDDEGAREEAEAVASLRALRDVVRLGHRDRALAKAVAQPGTRRRVYVGDFRASGVDDEVARTAARVFAEELVRAGFAEVVTQEEVAALQFATTLRQAGGCEGPACTEELTRALATEATVHGAIGRVGDTFVFSVSLFDPRSGLPPVRSSRSCAAPDELLRLAREAARRVAAPGS